MIILLYPVNVANYDDVHRICSRIHTDPRAFAYLAPKSNILHFFAENVDYRAAAFLKQELLSRGGDVIVTKHVIDGKTDTSDILIMGTPTQIRNLMQKLHAMDCWGLKELRAELTAAFEGLKVREWVMTSPAGHTITLNDNTRLMAIMNLTPDSFHAPSRINDNILQTAEKFLSEGAYILDVGAESTRPGAVAVSESEESARLIPALKELRREFPDAIISVDTYKPGVARIAAGEGADIINDVSGFTFGEGMPEVVAELNIPYVLSHIQGTPSTMAKSEPYDNIITDIAEYFSQKLSALDAAGVKRENIIIDPGLGFGKNEDDNFAVLKNIESLKIFARPVMLGHSRKRFTGGSLAGTLAVSAVMAGRVSLLRVHDVRENAEALSVAVSVMRSGT